MEPDRELAERVADEAYVLCGREMQTPRWRTLPWLFRGGFDPANVRRLVTLAGEDTHVLLVAHHRVWRKYHDAVARRAVKMLQEAALHVLEARGEGMPEGYTLRSRSGMRRRRLRSR